MTNGFTKEHIDALLAAAGDGAKIRTSKEFPNTLFVHRDTGAEIAVILTYNGRYSNPGVIWIATFLEKRATSGTAIVCKASVKTEFHHLLIKAVREMAVGL